MSADRSGFFSASSVDWLYKALNVLRSLTGAGISLQTSVVQQRLRHVAVSTLGVEWCLTQRRQCCANDIICPACRVSTDLCHHLSCKHSSGRDVFEKLNPTPASWMQIKRKPNNNSSGHTLSFLFIFSFIHDLSCNDPNILGRSREKKNPQNPSDYSAAGWFGPHVNSLQFRIKSSWFSPSLRFPANIIVLAHATGLEVRERGLAVSPFAPKWSTLLFSKQRRALTCPAVGGGGLCVLMNTSVLLTPPTLLFLTFFFLHPPEKRRPKRSNNTTSRAQQKNINRPPWENSQVIQGHKAAVTQYIVFSVCFVWLW